MKTVVTKYEAPLMRSNANPRRYNDPFATMLAAVAAASFATISGPAAMKPAMPARMQSNQQAPAILAWRTGDSFLKRAVSSDSLIAVPPDSSRIQLRSLKFEMFESTAMNTQTKEPQGWEGRVRSRQEQQQSAELHLPPAPAVWPRPSQPRAFPS